MLRISTRQMAVWAVAALMLTGCLSRERIPNQRALEPGDAYVDALQKATRQVEYFEDLDVHVHVFATQLSPAFTEAFRKEFRDVYGVSPTASDTPALNELTYILAITANDNELTKMSAFGSLWRLTYADGSTAPVIPSLFEKYDRDALFMRYFFPYWNPWRKVYRVSFPVPVTATTGTLSLQGVAGDIRMTW